MGYSGTLVDNGGFIETDKDPKFLKIGVSINLQKRLAFYRHQGVRCSLIKEIKSDVFTIASLEKDALKRIKENGLKYKPIAKFSGVSECLNIAGKDFILDLYDNYEKDLTN